MSLSELLLSLSERLDFRQQKPYLLGAVSYPRQLRGTGTSIQNRLSRTAYDLSHLLRVNAGLAVHQTHGGRLSSEDSISAITAGAKRFA
jgi:hypothetical protein